MSFRIIHHTTRDRLTRARGEKIYRKESRPLSADPEEASEINRLIQAESRDSQESEFLGRHLRRYRSKKQWLLCSCGTGAAFTVVRLVGTDDEGAPVVQYKPRRILNDQRPSHAKGCSNSAGVRPTTSTSSPPSSRKKGGSRSGRRRSAPEGKAVGIGIGSQPSSKEEEAPLEPKLSGPDLSGPELSLGDLLLKHVMRAARFEHAGSQLCGSLRIQNLAGIFVGGYCRDSAALNQKMEKLYRDSQKGRFADSVSHAIAELSLIQRDYLRSGFRHIQWPLPPPQDLYKDKKFKDETHRVDEDHRGEGATRGEAALRGEGSHRGGAKSFADVSAVAASIAPSDIRQAIGSISQDDRPLLPAGGADGGVEKGPGGDRRRYRYVVAFAHSWEDTGELYRVQGARTSCSFEGEISGRTLGSSLNGDRCPPHKGALEAARQEHYLVLWQVEMNEPSPLGGLGAAAPKPGAAAPSPGAASPIPGSASPIRATAYAQPVFSPAAPLPVDSISEKAVIWYLIAQGLPQVTEKTVTAPALHRPASEIKGTEDTLVSPGLMVEVGGRCVAIIDVMQSTDASCLEKKRRAHRLMREIAPLYLFDGSTYDAGEKAWARETRQLTRWLCNIIAQRQTV